MGNLCGGEKFEDIETIDTLVPAYRGVRKFQPENSNTNESKDDSFTLMTYNILADGYEDRHESDCNPNYLTWDYRWKRIKSQMIAYDADIICLQEPTLRSFKKSMNPDMNELGFEGIHGNRVPDTDIDQSDALFIRKDRFKIIKSKIVRFKNICNEFESFHTKTKQNNNNNNIDNNNDNASNNAKKELINAESEISDSGARASGAGGGNSLGYHNLFRNEQVRDVFEHLFKTHFWDDLKFKKDLFIIALLQDLRTNKMVFIVTSHLYWNPKFPDIKTAEAYILSYAVDYETDLMLKEVNKDGVDSNGVGNDLQCHEIPRLLCMDANAMAFKDYKDIFDPWIDESKNDSFSSGVYEVFTKGELSATHCEHPVGRYNLRMQWVSEIDDAKSDNEKEILNKKYSKAMGFCTHMKFKPAKETKGLNEIDFDWKLKNKWKSIYKEASPDKKEPPFTTRASWFEGCIDYVLMSEQGFEIVSYLDWERDESTNEQIKKIVPNKDDPSDHLPLVAKLRFV